MLGGACLTFGYLLRKASCSAFSTSVAVYCTPPSPRERDGPKVCLIPASRSNGLPCKTDLIMFPAEGVRVSKPSAITKPAIPPDAPKPGREMAVDSSIVPELMRYGLKPGLPGILWIISCPRMVTEPERLLGKNDQKKKWERKIIRITVG